MTLVVAQGALLAQAIHSTFNTDLGLSSHAYQQLESARSRTAFGRRFRRRLVLLDGSRLVASAVESDFRAVYQGEEVRICGIGLVAGLAGHGADERRRRLIDLVVERGRRTGAEMVALVAPRDADAVDAPPGFVSVVLTNLMLEIAKPARYGAPMTMVRGGDVRDLPAIVAMGRVRAATFKFHLDRDLDLIQYAVTTKRLVAGLAPGQTRSLQFFIAEEGTTAAAYVVLSCVGARWTLEECGDRDPSGARVGALLQALIAREPAEARPTISGWLPAGLEPPQVTATSTVDATHVLMLRDLRATAAPRITAGDVLFWRGDLLD